MNNIKDIFPEIIIKENDYRKTEIYIDGKIARSV